MENLSFYHKIANFSKAAASWGFVRPNIYLSIYRYIYIYLYFFCLLFLIISVQHFL